jgi:hypothetical protein
VPNDLSLIGIATSFQTVGSSGLVSPPFAMGNAISAIIDG